MSGLGLDRAIAMQAAYSRAAVLLGVRMCLLWAWLAGDVTAPANKITLRSIIFRWVLFAIGANRYSGRI